MKKEKSWGVSWNPVMYHSIIGECKCGALLSMDPKKELIRMVGFTSTAGPQKQTMAGIAIFECEKCSGLFWFHASGIYVEFAKHRVVKWPKE